MYQPYPGSTQMPAASRPPAPASVRSAVKLMYAGAAASLVGMVVDLTALSATKNAIEKHSPQLTASQVDGLQHTLMIGWIAGGLIAAGLWIFIAQACKNGRNWARITGTVFFGIATLDAVGNLAVPEAAAVKIVWFAIWLVGLGAVVFLWRRSSSEFFTSASS
jgi:hypothetical protein